MKRAVLSEMRRLTGLDETRDIVVGALMPSDRTWSRVLVVTQALAEVLDCAGAFAVGLEEIALNGGVGAATARGMLDGPLAALTAAVKATGVGLSEYFLRDRSSTVKVMGGLTVNEGPITDCTTHCLRLRGEVAEALAVLAVVAPEVAKRPEHYRGVDAPAVAVAAPKLAKGAPGWVDALTASAAKLVAELATGND